MQRRRFLQLAGASAAGAVMGASTAEAGRSRRPNVIVVFADDMGYGDLSCYGHPTIRTPNLDTMASEGMRLTSFYAAAPFCTPSRVGLLTGRYPIRTGQAGNLGPASKGGLSTSEITLGNCLQDLGYRTMCIGKWHLGHTRGYRPTERGFDQFFGLPYSNDMIRPWVQTDVPMHLYRDTEPVEEHPVDQDTLTERYISEAVNFIRSSEREPFFLYFPHSMPHLPVRTSSRFRGTSRSGLYGDVIETIDWGMGEIFRTLRQQGIDRNTLVLFTSDNGPWLDLPDRMLQGGNERWHAGSKGLFRGHKGNTYEGGMRVPCIARWPGRIPRGQTSADMASTLDVFPTVAAAAGGEAPRDRVIDGQDLWPFLQGRSPSPVTEFFYCRGANLEAVRDRNWKLRLSRHSRPELQKEDPLTPELFDLELDPAEQYNRAGEQPQATERLEARLREFGEELGARVAPAP